jgi:hypothetical protein
MCRKTIFVCVFITAVTYAKTIIADVTADGVADEIVMGLKTVVVKDGASGTVYTVGSEVEFLADVTVGDYFRPTKGREIAIVTVPEEYETIVYGYRNKQFVEVSELLPGDITLDEEGRLFGYETHPWQETEALVYWPIIHHEGFLKPAPIVEESETTIVVVAGTTQEIEFTLPEQSMAVCIALTRDKNLIVFLQDEHGTLIKQGMVDDKTEFSGMVFAPDRALFSLNFDNSQSATDKTAHYLIRQYSYPSVLK